MSALIKHLVAKNGSGNWLSRLWLHLSYWLLHRNKSLRFPVFRRFLLYRLAIILSLNMQTAIISYFAYRLTVDPITQKGDAKVLGLMGLAEVIPAIGFSLFSGHFVDISEKRSVVFRSILAYLTLSVFFAFLAMPIAKKLLLF